MHKKSIRVFAACFGTALLFSLIVLPFGPVSHRIKAILYSSAAGTAIGNDSTAENRTELREGVFILFGRYLGEPILWQVIAVEDGCPLLFSEYILCLKAFTASEKPFEGSSNWQTSTLRQWLNSTQTTVQWNNTPPNAANPLKKYNEYADEAGFLSAENFTEREVSLIKHNEDAVFLLTKKQLQNLSVNSRRKTPTKTALLQDNSPYWFIRSYCWYWTADPITTNTQSVSSVTAAGSFYKSLSTDGLNGVCPALYLLSSTALSAGGDGSRNAPYQIVGGVGDE